MSKQDAQPSDSPFERQDASQNSWARRQQDREPPYYEPSPGPDVNQQPVEPSYYEPKEPPPPPPADRD